MVCVWNLLGHNRFSTLRGENAQRLYPQYRTLSTGEKDGASHQSIISTSLTLEGNFLFFLMSCFFSIVNIQCILCRVVDYLGFYNHLKVCIVSQGKKGGWINSNPHTPMHKHTKRNKKTEKNRNSFENKMNARSTPDL